MYPKIFELLNLPEVLGEIGLEIEIEGRHLQFQRETHKDWEMKGDGSLRGNEAIEYVLPGPISRDQVRGKLGELMDKLTEKHVPARIEPSDRCGVHVHVNCQQNTFQEVINHICLYFIVEDILLAYCGESREGNFYCLRAKDAEYLIARLEQAILHSDIQRIWEEGDNCRYAGMNMTALDKFGSLEFRSLLTPKDFTEVSVWVDLLLKIKDRALHYQNPKHMVEALSMSGPVAFFNNIFGYELGALLAKNVENLDLTLYEGVRRIQGLAYIHPVKNPITMFDLEDMGDVRRSPRRRDILEQLREIEDDAPEYYDDEPEERGDL